jgi:hypothetical protein
MRGTKIDREVEIYHFYLIMRLNSGNSCYHSVQILMFSYLLSKNVKITIYKTIILPVVLGV